MKTLGLFLMLGLSVPATTALAGQMQPALIGNQPIDVCSSANPGGGNDCSDTAVFRAASEACRQNNMGSKADHWALQGFSGQAQHWTGGSFQMLPSGAVFSSISCSP